jgi:hypothetical protein
MNKPTRRVRGNSEPPPDEDLPIQFADEDKMVEKEVNDTIALIWFIVIIIVATALMMAIWGRL